MPIFIRIGRFKPFVKIGFVFMAFEIINPQKIKITPIEPFGFVIENFV